MKKLPFEQLSEDDFERLVVIICQTILGIGCTPFTKGRDGGRDAVFSGKADHFPSDAKPWEGDFIIQAKHVSKVDASCSDKDFFGNSSSVIAKEMKRMREVVKTSPLDCYLLFTNRKVTGQKCQEIENEMMLSLHVDKVSLLGEDYINTVLTKKPDIIRQFHLHQFSSPERFYEKDIQKVIILFDSKRSIMNDSPKSGIDASDFCFVEKEEKNRLNKLSDEYFEFIRQDSLPFFRDIDVFLKSPENSEYRRKYENTTSDIKAYMLKNGGCSESFMYLLENIVNIIADEDEKDIFECRRLVRTFVHFMYWNCDIGRKI